MTTREVDTLVYDDRLWIEAGAVAQRVFDMARVKDRVHREEMASAVRVHQRESDEMRKTMSAYLGRAQNAEQKASQYDRAQTAMREYEAMVAQLRSENETLRAMLTKLQPKPKAKNVTHSWPKRKVGVKGEGDLHND